MSLVMILEGIAAVSALGYLGFTAREASALRSLLKTGSVLLLALAAWSAAAPIWLVLGLALCGLGDFCLSRDGETAFMGGVAAFAAGHLAYVVLFFGDASSVPAQIWAWPQVLLTTAILALGGIMIRVLAPRAGALKLPVTGYIPIILAMGIAALSLTDAGLIWVLPAALAFMASDVVLAFETFVLAEDHPWRRYTPYVIWPLYSGAQAGFYLSFS